MIPWWLDPSPSPWPLWPHGCPTSRPCLHLEQRAGFELADLLVSPVYYGIGVPQGDYEPVLLLPGFLGTDAYLAMMAGWLQRSGYRPYASNLPLAAGSIVDLLAHVLRRADAIAQSTGQRLTVIGHSLGGIVGSVLARLRPDVVSHLVTLGSALRDLRGATHPFVVMLGDRLIGDATSPADRQAAQALEEQARETPGRPRRP